MSSLKGRTELGLGYELGFKLNPGRVPALYLDIAGPLMEQMLEVWSRPQTTITGILRAGFQTGGFTFRSADPTANLGFGFRGRPVILNIPCEERDGWRRLVLSLHYCQPPSDDSWSFALAASATLAVILQTLTWRIDWPDLPGQQLATIESVGFSNQSGGAGINLTTIPSWGQLLTGHKDCFGTSERYMRRAAIQLTGFETPCRSWLRDGDLTMVVTCGQASGLSAADTDQNGHIHYECQNVDGAKQQLILLAGLAALWQAAATPRTL